MSSNVDQDTDTLKRSVASIAYDEISDRIASGQFGSNERLTEAQLVKELGVSRGAVREAMSKLHADGLIEIELNKGAIVRAITRKDMSDFLQVRGMYDSFAARRAAERVDEPGTREEVRRVIGECEALMKRPSPEGIIQNDTSFHSAIMELSGNAIMAAEWRRLRRSRYRLGFLRSLSEEEIQVSLEQHRETLYAILDGDADKAAEFAARHVRLTNSRIQRLSDEKFDAIFNNVQLDAASSDTPLKAEPKRTKARTKSARAATGTKRAARTA